MAANAGVSHHHQRAYRIPGFNGNDIICDLFDAEPAVVKRSAVIFVHGGGFVGGSRDQFLAAAAWLALAADCFCITVDYRTASEALYPAAVLDCLAVFQWLFQSQEQYRVDPEQVYVVGGSPGANIGAMAMMADEAWLSRYQVPQPVFQPRHGIFLNGIYHLKDFYDRNPVEQNNVRLYLGERMSDPGTAGETSFEGWNMAGKNLLLLHGDHDLIIPVSQCYDLQAKAAADGGNAEIILFPGAAHAWFNHPESQYGVLSCIKAFIDNIRNEVELNGTC